ncbi:MAG: IS200/IS605 family transposase [Gammaproteobacteria bacterium]|nr:IS200/IS605 family transposase [Gammaproteobacteria bacterium]
MNCQRRSGHTVTQLKSHIVWVAKYRYPVLMGEIQKRCRELIIQICDAEDIRILKGVVSKDHIHMHIEYPARLSISDIVKRLKGRASRRLQDEFPELKKRYWGRRFGAIGYGAWSTGNITDEMIQEYLEHHRDSLNEDTGNIMLE